MIKFILPVAAAVLFGAVGFFAGQSTAETPEETPFICVQAIQGMNTIIGAQEMRDAASVRWNFATLDDQMAALGEADRILEGVGLYPFDWAKQCLDLSPLSVMYEGQTQ